MPLAPVLLTRYITYCCQNLHFASPVPTENGSSKVCQLYAPTLLVIDSPAAVLAAAATAAASAAAAEPAAAAVLAAEPAVAEPGSPSVPFRCTGGSGTTQQRRFRNETQHTKDDEQFLTEKKEETGYIVKRGKGQGKGLTAIRAGPPSYLCMCTPI